jgi:SAM-dependent methyltransferase
MPDLLLQVFSKRPSRYALLDQGLQYIGFGGNQKVLEIGCAYGDAVFHIANRYPCDITGVDQAEELINYAMSRHEPLLPGSHVEFRRDDAQDLRLCADSYDLIVSEAAFSPLRHKETAVENYRRVLRLNGRVLLNDFAVRYKGCGNYQKDLAFIPCFSGVESMEEYVKIFENSNFKSILVREEYGEFIALALFLGKKFGVAAKDLGSYLVAKTNETCGNRCDELVKAREDFFRNAKLTYCQMIFEKNE